MKNGLLAFAAAAAVSVAAISAGSVAFADPAQVFINDQKCGVGDASLNPFTLVPLALGGTAVVQSVLLDDGNVRTTCSGTLPTDGSADLPPTGAVVFTEDNLGCQTRGYPADKVIMVVTSSGHVMLSCQFKANGF